ncbi:MAG: class I SAM-dependent methyltransferase [bacterium]|nr:class I SAM-dependent methyltransferase [bacterium]
MSIKKIGTDLRVQKIVECFQGNIGSSTKVLDIGAGNGYISYYLQNKFGCDIQCADIMNYLEYDLPFYKITTESKLAFEDNYFDLTIIIDTLHHMNVVKQTAILQEATRVAKKVIIFDTERTLVAMILDHVMSRIQSIYMPVPCTHKRRMGWERMFTDLGFGFEEVKVKKGWLYPMQHLCFIVSRI